MMWAKFLLVETPDGDVRLQAYRKSAFNTSDGQPSLSEVYFSVMEQQNETGQTALYNLQRVSTRPSMLPNNIMLSLMRCWTAWTIVTDL